MSRQRLQSHLRSADLLYLSSLGIRTRRLRASLSSLGVAIGVAAIVGVVGVSSSSVHDLLLQLDQLSNLLTVTANPTFLQGGGVGLPSGSIAMVNRIGPVTEASAIGRVDATVRRTDRISPEVTLGISVVAARTDLLAPIGGGMAKGVFLNNATIQYPAVVLGSIAAQRLGIERLGLRVYLGEHWFTVIGILDPVRATPEIDRSALIGFPVAETTLGFDGAPSIIYLRVDPNQVDAVRDVLPATANPAHPETVQVSRPSDALAARAAARLALRALLLGLGTLALLVGGIGIANVMFISVLERRSEIGIRRALGATKVHVALQFLTEAVVLSSIGGLCGLIIGSGFSLIYAQVNGWPIEIPLVGLAGGLVAAVGVGVVGGFYPALRAARLTPSEALRGT